MRRIDTMGALVLRKPTIHTLANATPVREIGYERYISGVDAHSCQRVSTNGETPARA